MTNTQKGAIGFISCIIIFLCYIVYSLTQNIKTYESALDNTVDATIMEIEEHKNVIKGERLKIANKCKKIAKNLPYRFVADQTCTVE